jgi:hypothetical protein
MGLLGSTGERRAVYLDKSNGCASWVIERIQMSSNRWLFDDDSSTLFGHPDVDCARFAAPGLERLLESNVDAERAITVSAWHEITEELRAALAEVDELTMYEDGWKGAGTLGALPGAASDTKLMLQKISRLGTRFQLPMIGLDDGGVFCLTWDEHDLLGNLSIRGNGRYSFSIQRGGTRFRQAAAELSQPAHRKLIEALS